ncbi:Hypothetical protein CINCED_3A011271 [Cinara cedri]|uniref:Uncharacterized protein n=1 Tax=Cinara cedri TaxID=506608 RepID=A0A5E4MET9_9HEMI|nr:Hypothetical protein CINCED_3A011271 [Cinara cedri]
MKALFLKGNWAGRKGLPNSNDTFESYSIRRKIYLRESFSHISSAPLGLISPEKFNELREGKTIKGENYPTYLMRIHLNGYVPLKKDLWTKEYNELYPDN